jgi:hypothetical protein
MGPDTVNAGRHVTLVEKCSSVFMQMPLGMQQQHVGEASRVSIVASLTGL